MKTTLNVAKKYVETYFISNAAAQDPEQRVFYNYVHSLIKWKHNHNKIKRVNTTTERPGMT